jgi:hypothetical protein
LRGMNTGNLRTTQSRRSATVRVPTHCSLNTTGRHRHRQNPARFVISRSPYPTSSAPPADTPARPTTAKRCSYDHSRQRRTRREGPARCRSSQRENFQGAVRLNQNQPAWQTVKATVDNGIILGETHLDLDHLIDWSDSYHYGHGTRLPCIHCGRESYLIDDASRSAHKICVETALAKLLKTQKSKHHDQTNHHRAHQQCFRTNQCLRCGRLVDPGEIYFVFELVASIRLGDADCTRQLRHRYLGLLLDGLHSPSPEPLAGPPPTWQEVSGRWVRPANGVSDRPLCGCGGAAMRSPSPPESLLQAVVNAQLLLRADSR